MSKENQITLVGTVGGDPELRFTPAGAAVVNFSVASTPRKKEGDKWVDGTTSWFRCSAWRDMAENIASSIQKGSRVIVVGEVQIREWEDRDGNKRTAVEIQVDEIGPSLRWATTVVERTTRVQGEGAGNYEAPARPAGGKKSPPSEGKFGGDEYQYDDEPPF